MYLNGLHLGIGPSSPVIIEVHLLNLPNNDLIRNKKEMKNRFGINFPNKRKLNKGQTIKKTNLKTRKERIKSKP